MDVVDAENRMDVDGSITGVIHRDEAEKAPHLLPSPNADLPFHPEPTPIQPQQEPTTALSNADSMASPLSSVSEMNSSTKGEVVDVDSLKDDQLPKESAGPNLSLYPGFPLREYDLKRLDANVYVNDEIVNFYFR